MRRIPRTAPNPYLFKNLGYDPVKDFRAGRGLGSYVFMLVVARTCR